MNALLYIFVAGAALNAACGDYVVTIDGIGEGDTGKASVDRDMQSGDYIITFSSDVVKPDYRIQFENSDGDIYESIEGSLCDWEKDDTPEGDAANLILDVLSSADCVFGGNGITYGGTPTIEAYYEKIADIIGQNDGPVEANVGIWEDNNLVLTLALTLTNA